MTRPQTDIFISGGGIAGLVAAAALGRAGFSVVLADPAPPVAAAEDDGSDLRSTAYLQPARDLLDATGLWPALSTHATPLQTLRVMDTADWPPTLRAARSFESSDLGDRPFGWNIPNWLTRKVLADTLTGMDRVDLRLGTGFAALVQREAHAIVTLTDGSMLQARLVIGADGHASPVREAAGIGTDIRRYGQKALAFSVTHPHPHNNVSTEIYNRGGAFTLVPMRDHQGGPASAVVWMNDGARAQELLTAEIPAFEAEMTERSMGVLGHLTLASPRRIWPVVTQSARALTARRVALVAEAAHVLPPIGAQGLNTSLNDIAALVQLAEKAPDTLGSAAMLAAYEKARARDTRTRARVIDLFNRVCKSDDVQVQALRLAGLKAVHDIAPLRRTVMQAGLGSR